MQVPVLILVLSALLCVAYTKGEEQIKEATVQEIKPLNVEDNTAQPAEVAPAAHEALNARQSRLLRRIFPNVYLHTSLGRVASDIDDLADYDMEELERAVRKQKRTRRRKTLASNQALKKRRRNNKKKTKKTTKKGVRTTKKKSNKRKASKGKKPRRPKKPKKPVKKPAMNNDESHDETDDEDVYQEEIHKMQREPGQPISVMIVEQDF